MGDPDLEDRLRSLMQRIDELLCQYEEDIPEFLPLTGTPLILATIQALMMAIEDPDNERTDWANPSMTLPWGVQLSRTIWPLPIGTPSDGLEGLKWAALTFEITPHAMKEICYLRVMTKGVILVWAPSGWVVYFPPDIAEEARNLTKKKWSQKVYELLNPAPITFPFATAAIEGKGDATGISGAVEVRFHPLLVMEQEKLLSYPIHASIHFTGRTPAGLNDDARGLFWQALAAELDKAIPGADLTSFSKLLPRARLVEFTTRDIVPAEYAVAYKDVIESFATWQGTHLRQTEQFASVEGTLRMDEIKANLSQKQENDYRRHKYCQYDKMHIPGTVPKMRSNLVVVNGRQTEVPDQVFQVLLRLVVELKKRKGGWVFRSDFKNEGIVDDAGRYQPYSELRKALKPALPEKAEHKLIETGSAKRLRLSTHPDFVTYDKKRLEGHPDMVIARLAKQLPRSRRTAK